MKITRKVLVALLSLALIASCFALSVSAAVGEITDENYDDVLGYFDDRYYVNKDFTGAAGTSSLGYATEGIVSTIFGNTEGFSVGGNGTSTLQIDKNELNVFSNTANGNEIYFDVTQTAKESFGINANFKFPSANVTFKLLNGTKEGTELFVIKAKTITVGGTTNTSSIVSASKYADLNAHFLLNPDGSAKLTVTFSNATATETYTADFTADQVGDYTGFRIDFAKIKTKFKFTNLQIYPGYIPRTGADNTGIVADYILALSDAINAAESNEVKAKYANVIYTAVSEGGFDTNKITDAELKAKVDAAIVNAKTVLGETYITLYTEAADKINTTLSYSERIAAYNTLVEYKSFVDLVYGDQTQEVKDAVDAATAKVNAEKESIDVVVANTKASVDLLEGFDSKTVDYATLVNTLQSVAAKPIAPDYADETYTAERIVASLATEAGAKADLEARNTMVALFAENVAKATKPETETAEEFAARYEAYILAKANYYTDVTYNEFAPEGAENYVEGLMAAFDLVEQEMNAESEKAVVLAQKVEYTTVVGYLYVKNYLNKLASDIDAANLGYPGVADTVALYNEYVTAADALSGDTTVAELLEYLVAGKLLENGVKYDVTDNFGVDIVTDTVDGVTFSVVLNAGSDVELVSFNEGVLKIGAKTVEGLTAIDVDVYVAKVGEAYVAYVSVNGDVINVTKVELEGAVTGVTATSTTELYAYNGSFVRNPVSADEMANLLCETVSLYNAAGNNTEENYLAWIEVIYNTVIKANGFSSEFVSEGLKEATDNAIVNVAKIVGNYYAFKLIDGASKIDVTAAYDNRLSFIETLTGYMNYIVSIEEEYVMAGTFEFDADPEIFESAREAYTIENDLLVTIAEQTKAAVEAVLNLPAKPAYKELYLAVQIFNENPIDATYYDDTYSIEVVMDAYDTVKRLIKNFAAINASAKAFVENTLKADNANVGEDESEESFRTRYYAYLIAKENFFDDETYTEYIGIELTLAEVLAIYANVDAEMVVEIANANNVIGSVAAAAPLNFYAKAEAIVALKALVEGANLKFPGVKEAVESYNSIVEFVNAKSIERLALEFVEIYEGKKYLSDNFDDAENTEWIRSTPQFAYITDEVAFNKSSAFAYRIVDGVMTFRNLGAAHFDVTPENAGSFGINLTGKLSALDDSITLAVYNGNRTSEGVKGIELITIEAGKVTVYTADGPVEYASAVKENTVFSVSAYYEVTAKGANLAVTVSLDDNSEEVYFVAVNDFTYSMFELVVTEVALDSIDVYAGSFNRSTPNVVELTAKYINDIVAAYNADNTVNFLDDLARVITTNKIAVDTIADETLKATALESIKTALTVVGNDYATKIIAGAEAIDVNAAYNTRLDHYNAMMALDKVLGAIQTDFTNVEITATVESINTARATFAAEKVLLDTAKENTYVSYEAAYKVPNLLLASYKDLRDAYDTFKAYPICDTFYDELISADDMANVLALIQSINDTYNNTNKNVLSFYESVFAADNRNVSADETPEAFALRYAAYINAKNLYFSDATYNEYLPEGVITVEEILAIYDLIDAEMIAVTELAEEFISIVKEANLSLSYSVKKIALAQAAILLANVEQGYPGVVDTITLYNAIKQNVTDKEAAAKAYIEAVLAIANANDFASKKAAIAAAKALAAAGSDVSVDVVVNGVSITQANILFSDAESEIMLLEIRVENFVSAVNAIQSATGLEAKKAAIVKALSFKAKADVTNASVITATAALDKAIADYNAAINTANTALESAVNVMASAVVKTVPTKPAAQVVAIVKKFFD